MKKILLSLFIVTISFLLSSCSKSVRTNLPPRTISRLKPYEYYSEYILLVTINHEDSLKFIDYTIKDFKIDNIRAICECTGYVLYDQIHDAYHSKEFNEESN